MARKRPYEPLEMTLDERIDSMFERRWSFGQWVLAIIGGFVAVGLLLLVGNLVLGWN